MNTDGHDRAMAHVRRAIHIMNKRRQFGATEEEQEQVKRLGATWKINHVSKEDAAAANACPICLGTEGDNWVSFNCCGTPFHANCITKWLQVRSACPMCREPVAIRNDCMFKLMAGQDLRWQMEIEVKKGAKMGVMEVFEGTVLKSQGSWGFAHDFIFEGKQITFHHMHGAWYISYIEGAQFDRLDFQRHRTIGSNKNTAQLQNELGREHGRFV